MPASAKEVAVRIIGNASGLRAAFNGAKASVSNFENSMQRSSMVVRASSSQMFNSVGWQMDLLSKRALSASATMKRMQRSVASLTGSLSSMKSGLIGLLAAVGAVKAFQLFTRAVREFVGTINESIERMDRLAKTADRVGISVQRLRELQLGATLSGADAGTPVKLMQRLSKVLGDAADGSKTAQDAFDRLGLSTETLAGIPLDRALETVANALRNLGRPTERIAVALKLFGGEGAEALNFLENFTIAAEDARQTFARAGIAISAQDTQRIEQANDAMARARAIWEAVKDIIVAEFAPAITEGAAALLEMASRGEGIGETVRKEARTAAVAIATFADIAVNSFNAIKNTLGTLETMHRWFISIYKPAQLVNSAMKSLWKTMSSETGASTIAQDVKKAFDAIAESGQGPSRVTAGFDENEIKRLERVQDILDKLQQSDEPPVIRQLEKLGATADQIEEAMKALEASDAADAQKKFETSIESTIQSLNDQITAFGRGKDGLDLYKLRLQGLDDATAMFIFEQQRLVTLLEAGLPSEADAAIDRHRALMDMLRESYDKGAMSVDQFRKASVKLNAMLEDVFEKEADFFTKRVEDPTVEIERRLRRLKDAFERKDITPDVFTKNMEFERKELEKLLDRENTSHFAGVGAISRGTAEAIQAEVGAQQREIALLTETRAQTQAFKRAEKLLEDIKTNTGEQAGVYGRQ